MPRPRFTNNGSPVMRRSLSSPWLTAGNAIGGGLLIAVAIGFSRSGFARCFTFTLELVRKIGRAHV